MARWWLVSWAAIVGGVVAWSVIVIVVSVIGIVAVVAIVPVKHTLPLLEMVGDVIDALLSGCEAMLAEATLPRELGF
jgi:hypothetical protein